jgi:hypothetical protein
VAAPIAPWTGGGMHTDYEDPASHARAARDPDTAVTIADVRAFERRHGRIPRDAAVLMYSTRGTRRRSRPT